MYVLYHNPFSQHGRRIVALMEAAGLDHEIRHVALEKGEHLSPAYRAINPNHQVPTFQDGALTLFESNAVLRYLCEKHALSGWYPKEPTRRALVEQWLDWNQCRLAPAVVDIVLNKMFLGPQGDQQAIARGSARVAELAPILAAALDGSAFLVGDEPTIADISVGSNFTQLGLADAVPDRPVIKAWFDRVNAIAGVEAACRPMRDALAA